MQGKALVFTLFEFAYQHYTIHVFSIMRLQISQRNFIQKLYFYLHTYIVWSLMACKQVVIEVSTYIETTFYLHKTTFKLHVFAVLSAFHRYFRVLSCL